MLSTIARAELFLRAVADSPASLDAARARELASALLAHRQAVALAYGLPPPPDGSENGGGERGEAARGAEPRPLVLTHPVTIDFGGARVLCRCGHTFPLRDSRELTHFVACPACKRSDRVQRVENLLRARHASLVDERIPWPDCMVAKDPLRARLTSAEAHR